VSLKCDELSLIELGRAKLLAVRNWADVSDNKAIPVYNDHCAHLSNPLAWILPRSRPCSKQENILREIDIGHRRMVA
jgi:hypothetical protein